jgi:hypothetical protein
VRSADEGTCEIFGGYSYWGSNAAANDAPLKLNGASAAMVFMCGAGSGWWATSAYHQGNVAASGFGLTSPTFLVGRRLRWRNHTSPTLFGLLLGPGHAGGTLHTRSLGLDLSPLGANDSFVLTGTGGMDWKLSRRIGVRIFQAHYLFSQLSTAAANARQFKAEGGNRLQLRR